MFIKTIIVILVMVFPMISVAQPPKKGIVMSSYYTKNELVLSGKLLTFVLVAYNEFIKKTKDMTNYEVLILESDSEVRITFVPKSAYGEKVLGGRTSLGESVSYYVSKSNSAITRWHHHR